MTCGVGSTEDKAALVSILCYPSRTCQTSSYNGGIDLKHEYKSLTILKAPLREP